jgi:AcrR family transcriptional regulator
MSANKQKQETDMPMTDVIDRTDTDIRERILITAERLFREIGYQKTTVADIAKTLRMSPANVYRFFDSKRSITAGVVSRQMSDVDEALRAIAPQPRSATERLCEMLATMFRMNSERFAGDSKMHEMVAVAMDENWDVCQAHIDRIIAVTASVVADGIASGEFRAADPTITALCILTAMLRFIHPQLIAQFADKPSATFDQLMDFVFVALRAQKA